MFWRASEHSIRDSVRNAIKVAEDNGFQSIAFPLIGACSGSFDQEKAKEIMLDELQKLESLLEVTLDTLAYLQNAMNEEFANIDVGNSFIHKGCKHECRVFKLLESTHGRLRSTGLNL